MFTKLFQYRVTAVSVNFNDVYLGMINLYLKGRSGYAASSECKRDGCGFDSYEGECIVTFFFFLVGQ